MFVNWSSFVDTKYRIYNSGQGFILFNNVLFHITLGSYNSPNSIRYYDKKSGQLEFIKITDKKYKSILKIQDGFAMAITDTNKNGYEDLLVTYAGKNSGILAIYYLDNIRKIWESKTLRNPRNYPNASITVTPYGFLVGNTGDAPFLVRWNTSNNNYEVDTSFVHHNPSLKFKTRSIVNFKGLIEGVDGFVLNGINARLREDDTFQQYYFTMNNNGIDIKPWLDSKKMNTMSVTFVNVNPAKGIYGFLFGNWAQESYLYMFKNGKYLKTHKFGVSYCTSVIAADFDNDGKDEIFFANGYLYNTLYKVHDEDNIQQIEVGQAYVDAYYAPKGLFYMLSTIAMDIDQDGFLELYTTAGYVFSTGNGWFKVGNIYRNGNRYLRVHPKNNNSSSHQGAIVKITYEGKTYKRIIDNGGNAMSQSEPVAHFGLGNYNGDIDVSIKWTDGTKTHMKGVKGNQVLNTFNTFVKV
jgi:hypothetical protein